MPAIRLRTLLLACYLLLGLGAARPAGAQRWQRDSVLSQVMVKQLAADQRGYLWVGTDAGVLRYDGYELLPLAALRRGGPALPTRPITGLVADAAGTVWIGQEAALHSWQPGTGRLRRVALPAVLPGQHTDVTLLWAHPRTGQAWVGYRDGRLLALPVAGQALPRAAAWQLPRPLRWLAADSAGPGLWAATDGGQLYRLLPGRMQPLEGWPGRYLLPVPDTRPQQYVSTSALYAQDTPAGPLREVRRWGGSGLEEGYLPLLLPGRRWELASPGQWVGLRWPTAGGYPALTTGPAPLRRTSDTPLKYAVQATPDGLHWVYSRGARGCAKRRPQPAFLAALAGPAGQVYSTRTLTRLPDGRLLVASYGPLLVQAADSPLAPLRPLQPRRRGVPRIFYGLLTVGSHVYYAEENHGFGEFRPATGELLGYKTGVAPGQPHPNAQVLLRDHLGQLWGGARPGLLLLDTVARRSRPYATGPAAAWLAARDVRAIAEDVRHHLWLATDAGLLDLEPATGQLRRYAPGQPAPYTLPTADVLSLYVPPGGGPLWLGTRDQGLLQVQPGRGVAQQYTLGSGLLSATVVSVLPGPAGEVWAGTYAGLVRVQPARHQASAYTTANGLRDNELNRQAAWRDPDGALYVGGVGGLHRVVPAQAPPEPPAPRLLLTGTTRYRPDDPPGGFAVPTAAADTQQLRLPAGTRYAAWHLALSDYLAPAGASFRGQLLDAAGRLQWQGSAAHTLLLPLPAPGRYTLRLTGATAQGVPARRALRLPLLVEAAWWQHPVAWVLAALALAAAAYALHRRRLSQALREARLRNRIAADLHDEVGTLLTRVSVQAELLVSLPPAQQAQGVASLLRNSRAAASTMRDVVWGIDARADSTGSLADRMRDYLHQTAALAGWHTALDTTAWPDDELLSPALRQGVYRIFKEAVTNAVRHAQGATHLRVGLTRAAGLLTLTVADDGHALQLATPPGTGMGLANMRQRAADLGGQLTVGFQPGGGFLVQARVPLRG